MYHLPQSERMTLVGLVARPRKLHHTVVREIAQGRGPAILVTQGLAELDESGTLTITDKGRAATQRAAEEDLF